MTKESLISKEIVEEFERPGPRYTSYPTIPFWTQKPSQQEVLQSIRRSSENGRQFSLYFHLPFCEKLCHFCACFKVIDPRREHSSSYIDALIKEVHLVSGASSKPLWINQMHWGGGTPTFYSPREIEKIFNRIHSLFRWTDDAEISIEANPVVTHIEHLRALRSLGFNRISFGVQDFDSKVQDVINRHQTLDQTLELSEYSRALGFKSLNIDLIYGLPFQTIESIRSTISSIIKIRPDRIAFYSYANVPWKHPFQRRFKDEDLPTGVEKIQLYLQGRELLLEAGYEAVGMDHFALAHDELFQARANKKLHRNFMGYTTNPDTQLLGFGISAISMLDDYYWQNLKTLPEYYRYSNSASLPIERGLQISINDKIRRFVIMQIMCNFSLSFKTLHKEFQINFLDYFSESLETLHKLQQISLLELTDTELIVLPRGRLLIRNIAMIFDSYLESREDYRLFSMTI